MRSLRAIGVVLACLCATGIGFELGRSETARGVEHSPAQASAPADAMAPPREPVAAGAASVARPRAAVPDLPLPPLDTPLSASIQELEQRSRAGDAKATCRIAAEYAYCGGKAARQAELQNWLRERQLALKVIDSAELRAVAARTIETEMDGRQAQDAAFSAHCDGVRIPTDGQNLANWRLAAMQGSVAGAKHYASGNAFRWGTLLDSLPGLAIYKREAESISLEAARRGDVELALSLANAYDPSRIGGPRTLLGQSVRADGAMSLAIYERVRADLDRHKEPQLDALKSAIAERIELLVGSLPESEVDRARSAAARQLEGWSAMKVNAGTASIQPGRVRDMEPSSCASDD